MRYLYSFLMYLLLPYFLLRLWWKGKKMPAYRERIAERFCWDASVPEDFDIWIHAVSLGEVIAVTPLIEALLKKNKRLLITSMTATGATAVQTRFKDRVVHRHLPYDLPDALQRFFKKCRMKLGIIVETEIWPNLMAQAKKHQVPLLLVNARLSPHSFHRYKKLCFLFKPIVNQFTAIIAQSDADAERFRTIGADKERVRVFGNIKFDLQINKLDYSFAESCQQKWDPARKMLMAASTHEGEEGQLLAELRNLQAQVPGLLLLIAPRHPERFDVVYQLSKKLGLRTGLCSRMETINPENEVVILDSFGQLLPFYHIADYAFVGGSLVPVGGHNVLEPIAMGTPVFIGSHRSNFKAICDNLEKEDAIVLVDDAADLVKKLANLQANETEKTRLITNATRFLEANKGAVQRYVDVIEDSLSSRAP